MALSFGEGSRGQQRSLNQPVAFESPADFVLGPEYGPRSAKRPPYSKTPAADSPRIRATIPACAPYFSPAESGMALHCWWPPTAMSGWIAPQHLRRS